MPFIKTANRVQCVMKLIISDAGVAGFIQETNKAIHQVKKLIFNIIFIPAIKPMDDVSSEK